MPGTNNSNHSVEVGQAPARGLFDTYNDLLGQVRDVNRRLQVDALNLQQAPVDRVEAAPRVEWTEDTIRVTGTVLPGRPSTLNTFSTAGATTSRTRWMYDDKVMPSKPRFQCLSLKRTEGGVPDKQRGRVRIDDWFAIDAGPVQTMTLGNVGTVTARYSGATSNATVVTTRWTPDAVTTVFGRP